MSRSRRHTPVVQMCGHTQKEWKRTYNRAMRHRNKILTRTGRVPHTPIRGEEQPGPDEESGQQDWEDQVWLRVRDVSDIWTSPSDGWVGYWNWFTERQKRSPSRWRTAEDDAEYEERWKARVWRK
jgi:hypothetical protein